MATTYTLIDSEVLTSTTASVTFSSIAADWTDLVVRCSTRTNTAGISDQLLVTVNGLSANFSTTFMGTTNSSSMFSDFYSSVSGLNGLYTANGDTTTSNSFSSAELYIPSYTATQNKPMSLIGMGETNATIARSAAHAFLSSNTAAITSVTIACNGSFLSGSSFYLYGISNA